MARVLPATPDDALSFTELRKAVGLSPGAEFNYHLEKVTGHFVWKTDDGYELCQPGARVVEAVLSGIITEEPTLEPTRLEFACQLCGAPTIVSYREEWVSLFCTECEGFYGQPPAELPVPVELSTNGYLGGYSLSPAGLQGRSAIDVFETAATWEMSNILAQSQGVCMRCSAPLEVSTEVCAEHDDSETFCGQCGRRYAVGVDVTCNELSILGGRCTRPPHPREHRGVVVLDIARYQPRIATA